MSKRAYQYSALRYSIHTSNTNPQTMNRQSTQQKEKLDTDNKVRKPGFYWIQFYEEGWTIGQFDGEKWWTCGDQYFYFDIDLKNIDNHKIQSRHEQDNY